MPCRVSMCWTPWMWSIGILWLSGSTHYRFCPQRTVSLISSHCFTPADVKKCIIRGCITRFKSGSHGAVSVVTHITNRWKEELSPPTRKTSQRALTNDFHTLLTTYSNIVLSLKKDRRRLTEVRNEYRVGSGNGYQTNVLHILFFFFYNFRVCKLLIL